MDFDMSVHGSTIAIIAIIAWALVSMNRAKYGYGLRMRRRDRRMGLLDDETGGPALPSPRESEMEKELERLRERVKVLERIATDANTSDYRHSRAIADEIESLRDK